MADSSHISVPLKGMNKDAHEMNMDEQGYDYALNADTEDTDGEVVVFQNIGSTLKAFDFPGKLNVVGELPIIEQNRVLFFLEGGGFSLIGEEVDVHNPTLPDDGHTLEDDPCADCDDAERNTINATKTLKDSLKYYTIAVSDCMGFSIHHPISAVYRATSCGIEVVFTDGFNERRRIEFEFTDPLDPTSRLKVKQEYLKITGYANPEPDCGITEPVTSLEPVYSNEIDCDKLSFQPRHQRLDIEVTDEVAGGTLQAGVYQFFAAYADEKGNALTSYKGSTNPAPLFSREITVDTDYKTGKALVVKVDSEVGGAFEYFNLAVAKTINNFTTFELVGTYTVGTSRVVYTGFDTYIKLDVNDIFDRVPYYKTAGKVTSSNNVLFFTSPGKWPQGNWQRVAEHIKLKWQTVEMPMGSYKNPVFAAKYKGYTRDEVVPFGIVFEMDNGDETVAALLANRTATASDLELVPTDGSNKDAWKSTSCEDPVGQTLVPKWKVYNTASKTGGAMQPFDPKNPCVATPWAEGEFAYWESTEKYPNDQEIWGNLAGKPIRHFKFPDFDVAPFFNEPGRYNMVYPIGVKVNHVSVIAALDNAVSCGHITAEDRARVKGYRIVRGNKAGWNSIVAKGLLYDSWSYSKKNKTYFYPNYPFNDLRPDPFISPTIKTYDRGFGDPQHTVSDEYKNKFTNTGRYTFHSPETHFNNPSIEGIDELKIEACFTGESVGEFKEVENHAKYKMSPMSAYMAALLLAAPIAGSNPDNYYGVSLPTVIRTPVNFITQLFDSTDNNVDATKSMQNAQWVQQFLNNYELWKTMTEALAPFTNYAVQHQAIGNYTQWVKSTAQDKRRKVGNRAYLPGKSVVFPENGDPFYFNNWHRESSVYLKVDEPIKTASSYFPDNSRYTISEVGACSNMENKTSRTISSLYASIKRPLPSQYGSVYSIDWIDCGAYATLEESDPMVFGGDTFIGNFALKRKHPFFLYTGMGFNAGADLLYSEIGNAGYPNYYLDTQRGFLEKVEDFSEIGFKTFLSSFNSNDIIRKLFGLPVYRFDCREDKKLFIKGKVYTYSYGIANFPVESAANLDLRHGIDDKAGHFYPANQDLDSWLQEKNVPIREDNQYHYNTTYSKQNKESVIVPMTVSYEPTEICKTLGPNDTIYSSNWKRFRSADRHTFSFKNGKLIATYGIENDKVLALFEKTFEIFNAYITLPTSADAAIVSNGKMFESKPQQFSQTQTGYGGTQHSAFLQTEHGHVWTNAPAGEIFVLGNNGQGFEDITRYGMKSFFKEHLPFKILRKFPGLLDKDNPYYGIGITMGYQKSLNKLFITKLDYEVLDPNLKYDTVTREFYVVNGTGARTNVKLGDTQYFRNVSWTASYKFTEKAWKSFHSFIPNYYVSLPTYLQYGENNDCPTLWNLGLLNSSFQIYSGKLAPFEVQAFTKPALGKQHLKSVMYSTEVVRYHGYDEYYMDHLTFNKALVYNKRQTSGMLYLVPKDPNDQLQHISYPKPTLDGTEILVSRLKNGWSFNQFYNMTVGKNNNIPPMVYAPGGTHLVPNAKALDPFIDLSAKERMKGEVFRVRLTNDALSDYKFRLKWILNTQIDD